jgi:molecular chaperone HtpG
MSGTLQRLLKQAGQKAPDSKPILEINPSHPLVEKLKTDELRFADWSNTLFDMALLAEGGQLEAPGEFVRRINALLLSPSRSQPNLPADSEGGGA